LTTLPASSALVHFRSAHAPYNTIMSFAAFLSALFEHGRVAVAHPQEHVASDDMARAGGLLEERASIVGLEFPGEPPPLDLSVAVWAGTILYRGCQLAIYRELDAGAIDELLALPCPDAEPASRHFSADLAFVFLPDLLRQAVRAAADDPLVTRLNGLAAQWPLSSVGIAKIEPQHVNEVAAHPGLLQLYVDRILVKQDWPRLAHPAVRTAAQASLGAFAAQFPAIQWPAAAKYVQATSP